MASSPPLNKPVFFALTVLVLVITAFFSCRSSAAAATAPAGPKLGVFLNNPADLPSFETEVGRRTDMFLYYESIGEDLDTSELTPIAQQGRIIQLAWEPWDPGAPDAVNQPAYSLKNITTGNFDSDIHRWAQEMRNFGYQIIIRPMCEMNGDWTSWSGTVNGNSPADYIPAWRHIHDIFVQEGATNVKFDWSPNRDGDEASAQATFNTYYPGDAYVDYVGIDGYNWGTLYNTPDWISQWQSFGQVFGPSYNVFTTMTSKPLMVSETASTEVGGNKAQWITDMFSELPSFPRIASVTWFNINKETDWRVESSAASLAAFKAAVALPDTAPPAVSISSPGAGATVSGDYPVNVNASDDTGISKVELWAGATLVGTAQGAPYNFTLDTHALADGQATLTAKAFDLAGNSTSASINVNVSNSGDRDYYFGWYDNSMPGMQSWIVIGNPESAAQKANVYIGNQLKGSYNLAPGQIMTPQFPGLAGGPVKVVSTGGGQLVASERTLYRGSFSELAAAPSANIGTDNYLSWYDDGVTPGLQAWIIVGNDGNQQAQVEISVGARTLGQYSVPAGGTITPRFPGVIDGPVRVTSTNGQPLSVSERVVYGSSFNETWAAPAGSLSAENDFTWYDGVTPGMRTWVVISNQGSQSATANVYIAGRLKGSYLVPAGAHVTPTYPGVMDGPVRVVSTGGQPLVVCERSLFGGSFEETKSQSVTTVQKQWFAWYDSATPGMTTWLLIANQGSQPVTVNVTISGKPMASYAIPAGGRVTPDFTGELNGPVEVSATTPGNLIVSQRSIYFGSFSEVAGRSLS